MTDEGTMIKILPHRTSQVDGLAFHPQMGTTFMVDAKELLCCGLQIKIRSVNRKNAVYADEYYAPGDDRSKSIVVLRQTTIDDVLKKLDRWGTVLTKKKSSGSKKAKTSAASSSSSSGGGGGGGGGQVGLGGTGEMSDGADEDVEDVRPTVEEYKCTECGVTSISQSFIWFQSHIHDEGCNKFKQRNSSSSTSTSVLSKRKK